MNRFARILVIDDDLVACKLLTEMLQQSGYDVDYCSDPIKGIQKLSEQPYDVVVTDLKMPKANGLELLREAKRQSEKTQVILISAFGDERVWVESLGMGAYDFIPKPFKKREIIEVIREALDQQARMMPRREGSSNDP